MYFKAKKVDSDTWLIVCGPINFSKFNEPFHKSNSNWSTDQVYFQKLLTSWLILK